MGPKFAIYIWVYQGDGCEGDVPHLYDSRYVKSASDINPAIIAAAHYCQNVARAVARIEVQKLP